MNTHSLRILFLLFPLLPAAVVGQEGYSSAAPSIPANIYNPRAFTIVTLREACEKSPEVAEITLRLQETTIDVGVRIHLNKSDDSLVSDLVIEAFDDAGNFLPSVPVHVGAGSQGRTATFDPGIMYIDSSTEYWEARKPGKFDISANWPCSQDPRKVVSDRVTVEVVDSKN